MYIGDIIYSYRKENGISMQEFADRCDLSKAYISLLENKKSSHASKPMTPSIETYKNIASAMNMTLGELFEKTGNVVISLKKEPQEDDALTAHFVEKFSKLSSDKKLKLFEFMLTLEQDR